MKTIKKTKKNFKPVFTVDITECETPNDMMIEFGYAKQQAGLPITNEELEAMIDEAVEVATICNEVKKLVVCECYKPKKQPWYKRFWNLLTCK